MALKIEAITVNESNKDEKSSFPTVKIIGFPSLIGRYLLLHTSFDTVIPSSKL